MQDPALLAAVLNAIDVAISKLVRTRVALEEWETKNAPELHKEAQGLGDLRSFACGEVRN